MAEDDELRAAAGRPTNGYDLGRLLAFSDGVFAIAITLLVLNIPVPNLPAGTGPDEIRGALLALKPNLGGFVLSFFLVGTYWIGHHRLLLGANRLDGAGLWLNLFVLATVCLIPFSSGVLIRYAIRCPDSGSTPPIRGWPGSDSSFSASTSGGSGPRSLGPICVQASSRPSS